MNAGVKQRDDNFQCSFAQFTVKEGLHRYGDKVKEAVITEFRQLFKDKRAIIPVMKKYLTKEQLKRVI